MSDLYIIRKAVKEKFGVETRFDFYESGPGCEIYFYDKICINDVWTEIKKVIFSESVYTNINEIMNFIKNTRLPLDSYGNWIQSSTNNYVYHYHEFNE
jgi:hypothetical protein